MKYLLLISFVLMISNVCANCEEGQIDINSASAEELQDITQIGPAYAKQIINLRPFESINDLVRVSGIAEKRLETIKAEGLACVNVDEEAEEIEEEIEEVEELVKEKTENFEIINEEKETYVENPAPQVIKLNPQIIKSDDTLKGTSNNENSDNEKISGKDNYAVYGFVVFCLLLGFLFIIKKNRFNKNEFR